jgi:trimeric autotransporter adhesin
MKMRHLGGLWIGFLAVVAFCGPADRAEAQSDILLQLRSGSPAGDRVRVDSAGGFVAMGQLGIGLIPATGCGYRMMWYPFRGAFRAGTTDDGGACDAWNDSNIGFYSWAGGNLSRATAFATIAFGDEVTVSGVSATGFGSKNLVSGTAGFSAGASNRCTGFTCVSIGFTNNATGQGSVAIGYRSTANADYSIAIGQRASANARTGAVVISDASTTDSIRASANNQFSLRAAGGIRMYTNAGLTAGVTMNAGGSSWNTVSDRNRKFDFQDLDGEDVLLRLRSIPITRWRYRSEEGNVQHIGPMAQDWHAAFGLSDDPLTINSVDIDGVNLSAIQALERRTRALGERDDVLEEGVAATWARQAELYTALEERDRRIDALEREAALARAETERLRQDLEALRADFVAIARGRAMSPRGAGPP